MGLPQPESNIKRAEKENDWLKEVFYLDNVRLTSSDGFWLLHEKGVKSAL